MWTKLKQVMWRSRGVWIAAPLVTGAIAVLRFAGLLQFWELAAFDAGFHLRPLEPVDRRIAIVGLTESDIQKLGQATLSDELLAELLEKIKQQQPRVIGLDFYRDLPEEPGHDRLVQVFESTPNLIGIRKAIGNDGDAPIPPPPALGPDRVGANDVILDPDSKVRRYFLYVASREREIIPSFAIELALFYLKSEGILPKPAAVNSEYLQLGAATFVPVRQYDGGYVRTSAASYQMFLNYKAPPRRFPMVSVTEVLENRIPAGIELRDRIVLVGPFAQSKKDFSLTPYSTTLGNVPAKMFGVEIHANAISHIIGAARSERPLIKTWAEPWEWVWILAWAVVGSACAWRWRYRDGIAKISSILGIDILLGFVSVFAIAYLAFLGGWWIPVVPPALAIAGSAIAILGYLARNATKVRQVFNRYLTDEIVATLLESPEGLKLGGKRRQVTILMSDLRGFSTVSEQYDPETIVVMLNIYLEAMTEAIDKYDGTINEFIGDAILVLFGAPVQKGNDAQRAVACAVAMQRAMSSVNAKLRELGLPKLHMGIGINTGEVMAGNIGSQRRTQWTVIGSEINLASRIESYTVGGQILISEATLKEAGEAIVHVQKQKSVQPKGFDRPITIYDVGGIQGQYDLFLEKTETEMVDLAEEIPIEYAIIEGKNIGQNVVAGAIVKLSPNQATLRCEQPPKSEITIQMTLFSPAQPTAILGKLYAKVMEESAEGENIFEVHFTTIPPALEVILSDWVEKEKNEPAP